ncbi:unnamed protein product, partial [Tetraodon nigroviridis]
MLGYVGVALLSVAVLFVSHDWIVTLGTFSTTKPPVKLMSSHELSLYDGRKGSRGLYLAILGQVFDVHKGHKHYGPGGTYHCMTGKDASLAFVTGDFTEIGLTDDVSSLAPLQMLALYDWLAFYQKHYQPVGLLTGRFYSETGAPTDTLLQTEASLAEGQRIKAQSQAEKLHFPPCNSQWSAAEGGRVWCTNRSGGVDRSWAGVPRKLYSPGSTGVRCVCVK